MNCENAITTKRWETLLQRWTHHEQLRHDPMFGIGVGKLESGHGRCVPLADKSLSWPYPLLTANFDANFHVFLLLDSSIPLLLLLIHFFFSFCLC